MAEETENLTIRLLREMRGEMREMRTELGGRIAELSDGVGDLKLRIDGNTVLLTLSAGWCTITSSGSRRWRTARRVERRRQPIRAGRKAGFAEERLRIRNPFGDGQPEDYPQSPVEKS